MLTLSWRRTGASSAAALALVLGLPALAQAQLFPNAYIQRERTPCANEPPFYAHVRHNYYGYFPTCWRKFPEGWACPCPNPEAPNIAAAFSPDRGQPRDPKPELPPTDLEPGLAPPPGGAPDLGPGAPPMGGRGDGSLPPLPRSVQPLPGGSDLNPLPAPGPGRQPAAPGGNQPAPRDPFDPLQPSLPRGSGSGSSSLRTPAPSDAPPLEVPSAGAEPSRPGDALAGAGEPVLALPAMTRPDGSAPGEATMPASLAPDATTALDPSPSPVPAEAQPTQAPRRPSLIGGLLNRFRR